jgi:pimeloyl-ACP methyl ester carboxylesterase
MQKTMKANGNSFSYNVWGNGKVIVLIHGFAEDSRIWQPQIEFLKSNFKLLVPDLRGSGLSASAQTPSNIEAFATDIKEMLEAENIRSCTMLGHSMGGYITLAFAEMYPSVLNAFGLIHSTAFADSDVKIQARKKSIAFIKENGPHEFIKTTILNLFGELFKQQFPNRLAQLIEWGKLFTAEALIAYYNAMIERPDRSAVLKNTPLPVFFFIGEEDKAVNPADALLQSSYPQTGYVKEIPGIAHMGMWEAEKELNEAIVFFIKYVHQLQTETTLS